MHSHKMEIKESIKKPIDGRKIISNSTIANNEVNKITSSSNQEIQSAKLVQSEMHKSSTSSGATKTHSRVNESNIFKDQGQSYRQNLLTTKEDANNQLLCRKEQVSIKN